MLEIFGILGTLVAAIFTAIGVGLARSEPEWRSVGAWRILALGGGVALTLSLPAAVGASRHFGPGIFVVMGCHLWVGITVLACFADCLRIGFSRGSNEAVAQQLLFDLAGILVVPLLLLMMRAAVW